MLALHSLPVDSQCEILCHDAVAVDDLDASSLEILSPCLESSVAVELCAVNQATGPGEDGGNGVGGCLVALLVLAVVARNRTCTRG